MQQAIRSSSPTPPVPYEQRLSNDPRWALTEGSIFFEGKGDVQKSLRKIADRLNALHIPYAIVGGMALFHHGVRRFTEDVDILVTREDLKKIHEQLESYGYLRYSPEHEDLRDRETGVEIGFLIKETNNSHHFLAFPDPATNAIESSGIRYLHLEPLIELKLASGITAPARQKDLADIIALITTLNLPQSFSTSLNDFVRPTFEDLWKQAQAAKDYDEEDERGR